MATEKLPLKNLSKKQREIEKAKRKVEKIGKEKKWQISLAHELTGKKVEVLIYYEATEQLLITAVINLEREVSEVYYGSVFPITNEITE